MHSVSAILGAEDQRLPAPGWAMMGSVSGWNAEQPSQTVLRATIMVTFAVVSHLWCNITSLVRAGRSCVMLRRARRRQYLSTVVQNAGDVGFGSNFRYLWKKTKQSNQTGGGRALF